LANHSARVNARPFSQDLVIVMHDDIQGAVQHLNRKTVVADLPAR
jgi:hypothetical protein